MTERTCKWCEGDNHRPDSEFCSDACEDNANAEEAARDHENDKYRE